MNANNIRLKRIYSARESGDGIRILVDRLWPRNMSKENAAIDFWFKEISPSEQLRKWFSHDLEKWESFKKEYIKELKEMDQEKIEKIRALSNNGFVTLVFAAKNENYNNAIVLKDYILKSL